MTTRKKEPTPIGAVLNIDAKLREDNLRAVVATGMTELAKVQDRLQVLEVTDWPSMEIAAETVSIAQKIAKVLEERRVELTKPLLEEKQGIDRRIKELVDKLNAVKAGAIAKIDAYKAQERARVEAETKRQAEEAEQRRIAALLEAQDATEDLGLEIPAEMLAAPAPPPPAPIQARVQTSTGGVTERRTWRWRCIDRKAVPEELKVLNEVEINKLVREGSRAIPGLEIYQETTTVAI